MAALAPTGVAVGAPLVPLPDGRAYELVSPPEKGGSDVIQQTAKTHVATDGNGVTFSGLGPFGSLQGTSFDTEYVSHRTGAPGTNGWSTHGINPLGGSNTFPAFLSGSTPSYVNAFTPDLSAAIYKSWRPLTDAPNAEQVSNFYRIDGLAGQRTTAQLMTDSTAPPPAAWPTTSKLLIQPAFDGASTDLRHVVFESKLALTVDAPPYQGLFCVVLGFGCATQLYENADGVVRFVGRVPNAPDTACDDIDGPACVSAPSSQAGISATQPKFFYARTMVSEDGRRIFFQTPAGTDSGAIYMREDGVRTIQLAQDGELWTASTDGSRAFFITSESLLAGDPDSKPDLYMYDTDAPANDRLTLVSASATANDGTVGTVVGASADGHYVYFVCDGQLVAGEPPADILGLYVWHDGSLAYIGRFQDASEAQVNGPRTSYNFASGTSTARVTPDGRHVLFTTQDDAGFRGRGGFRGYDHAGRREFYLYSADTGRLACASCNPTGRAATADAVLDVREGAAVSGKTSKLSHALSDDGRRVFFSTPEALSPEDTNGRADAYEYDAQNGSVHLLSNGTDPAASYFIDASNDGNNAFFVTRAQLVGWDTDSSYDLYDARVGGGFPEPVPVAPCSSEACLPQQHAQAPAGGPPASAGYKGSGDTKARFKRHRRCRRGTVQRRTRGRTRCIRKPTRHTKHRHATKTRHAAAVLQHHGSGRDLSKR